jgi:hypothetical protein
MLSKLSTMLPAGTLDQAVWDEVKDEVFMKTYRGLVVAAVIAVPVVILLAGVLGPVTVLPHAPDNPIRFAGLSVALIAVGTVWFWLSHRRQHEICIGILDAADPAGNARASVRFVATWVGVGLNALFLTFCAALVPSIATIPFLVIPAVGTPMFALAACGAAYYARTNGSENAKTVCRTLYDRIITPWMSLACAVFCGGVALVAVLALTA